MTSKDNQKKEQDKTQAYMPPGFGGKPDKHYPGIPYPGVELARAYVPIQRFGEGFPPSRALETGTLFPELYRPYPY